MSDSEGEKLENEIAVVGRQLAFVNHKLQSQLETMKDLMHEHEISLGVEGTIGFLGLASSSVSPALDPFGNPLLVQPMLIPPPSSATIVALTSKMEDLIAAVLPLVQYDMFSWREDSFFANRGNIPRYSSSRTRPPCNRSRFQNVPVAVLGGKEVDMPYGLWEDLHRQIVRTDNAQFLKNNHPMLHVFYKSMEAQLCAVTKCRPEMHRNTPPVPKFYG